MLEWSYVLEGLQVTIQIWLGALALSVILAVPVAALRRSQNHLLKFAGALWVWLARGIPPVAWLIIIYFGLSLGIISEVPVIAAILGLGIVNSAYIGDSIRAGLEAVPHGQREAAQAVSLSGTSAMLRVILPQAVPIMIASAAAYSITLLKNTAIASIIGANELVFYAYNTVQIGAPALSTFFLIGLIYLAFTVPVGFLARWIDAKATKGVNA